MSKNEGSRIKGTIMCVSFLLMKWHLPSKRFHAMTHVKVEKKFGNLLQLLLNLRVSWVENWNGSPIIARVVIGGSEQNMLRLISRQNFVSKFYTSSFLNILQLGGSWPIDNSSCNIPSSSNTLKSSKVILKNKIKLLSLFVKWYWFPRYH